MRWQDVGGTYSEFLQKRKDQIAANKAAKQAMQEQVRLSPITKAVEPLKTAATNAAEAYAKQVIEEATKRLTEAGNDLQIVAPYPTSSDYMYRSLVARYTFYRSICKSRKATRSMREPEIADIDPKGVAKYIKDAREDAAFQFNQYVFKLVSKVGHVISAEIELVNGLWSHSILTVSAEHDTGNGTAFHTEQWRTKHILNQSKYGTVFSQFPTRLVQ